MRLDLEDSVARLKKYAKADHFRALVAAFCDAQWFAARVSWRAVQMLQDLGMLEHGAIVLTARGREVVARALAEPWFMHAWSEARTELERART